ncbi:MAG: rRNA maturation RNase YbeY [Planctomycetes bacterium]|nr:rRNA maturation RNase YbeY [Planctomycetota bacterium]
MIRVLLNSRVRGATPSALLKKAAQAALRGWRGDVEVSIAVVGDRRMRSLNRAALAHDYTTDVLSFHHGETPEGTLLELIICAPFAARMAKRHGLTAAQELARYVVHGCLHCAGHEDDTPASRAAMWKKQEAVLRRVMGKGYVGSGEVT